MKIGYLVEGRATDYAVVLGLREQLCTEAELVEGLIRGSSGERRRIELQSTCAVLRKAGVSAIVDLNDANELPWHKRRDQERAYASPEDLPLLVIGAPKPNIEMWLIADPAAFRTETGRDCRPKPPDAKPLIEQAFRTANLRERLDKIARFVARANLATWEKNDRSFKGFMDECRAMAHRLNCQLNP